MLKPRINRHVVTAKREPDPRRHRLHREFVASLPCAACGVVGLSQAAHLRARTDGGLGVKPSDRYCLPLCAASPGREGCHARQHREGETTFWRSTDVADEYALADLIWKHTGDYDACVRAIYRAKRPQQR